jgi:Aldehyde ferredoxin oxidoreductase, N-terminal domain
LSGEVQEGLEAELGDRGIRVLQTGVAAENLVRYAALCNRLRHFHGRAGLGAVMGSKNLKVVVVRGRENRPGRPGRPCRRQGHRDVQQRGCGERPHDRMDTLSHWIQTFRPELTARFIEEQMG